MKKNTYITIIIILVILIGGYLLLHKDTTPSSSSGQATPITSTTPAATGIEYTNNQYGFTFSLPADWKGYSVVTGTWTGTTNNPATPSTTYPPVHGPEITIRNPQWTAADKWQDIPIMIFTPDQWSAVLGGTLDIGAAPIPPSELGHNDKYVFALPARYNYAYPTGWQEVQTIMQGNPLHAF
jgi:hypothetical protein